MWVAAPGALWSPWVLAWSQQACLAPAVPRPAFASERGRIQHLPAGLRRMGASAAWQLVPGGLGLSLGGGDQAVGHHVGWVQGHSQASIYGVTGIGEARGSASPARTSLVCGTQLGFTPALKCSQVPFGQELWSL